MRLPYIGATGLALALNVSIVLADTASALKQMVGFTVIGSGTVSKVLTDEMGGDKYIILQDGLSFKVQFLFLRPLPMTDVVIFSKPFPPEIASKFPNAPKALLYQYKLLIDGETYDASPKTP